jgi:glycerol-3-phosphate acyltransferase PlsY
VHALSYIVVALGAYLFGSVPTGYLVARARGLDIRQVGSGNIGATNVFRALGKPAGVFVLLVDALKGLLACVLLPEWLGGESSGRDALVILAGVCAVLGHNFTCWLHFKGGKGIATSAGVLLAWVPWGLLVALGTWLVVFLLGRFVSLASIAAAAVLPFGVWFTHRSLTMTLVTAGLSALAIYKHKTNIQRLLQGTEPRLGWRKPPQPSTT